MKNIPKAKKVIWAMDAFTQNLPLHQKSAAVLKAWATQSPILIEPVYVMSPHPLSLLPEVFSHLAEQIQCDVKTRLTRLMKKARMPPKLAALLSPVVLTSNNSSLSTASETLLNYARQTDASFILASTQSKKGVNRFLFGSFAESLLLQSEIPIFLVSPKTIPSALQHILFATDLSEKSRAAFHEIVEEARERHFKITVYNRVEYLTDFVMLPLMASKVYQQAIDQDLLQRKTQANELVVWAKEQGVEVNAFVDDRSREVNVATAILKAATKTKADAVAMVSQSGRVASAILGSVTRQVVRGAKQPVWVIHPKNIEEAMPSKISDLSYSEKNRTAAI